MSAVSCLIETRVLPKGIPNKVKTRPKQDEDCLHLFAYYTISIDFVLTRYSFCRSGWKCELHLEKRSEENIMAKCVNCVCSLLKRSARL